MRPPLILIAGPTASGKSGLALAVAEEFGGTVINADSMQVYRDLAILTARPSAAEAARVPHRLYGILDAADPCSAARWRGLAAGEIAAAAEQRRLPILVGGTGLYFKALTAGLAAVPPIPADIRADVRSRLQREGAPALHAELVRLDPATAQRVTVNDRSRISRALEVALATGRPLSDWHIDGLPPIIDPGRAAKIFITCERPELVRRIEMRFASMLKSGALEEVRELAARKLDPLLPAMKAHGVPWLIRHVNSEISLQEAEAGAVMDTRRYAKRQLTWFRNQMKDWPWETAENAVAALEIQLSGLK